MKFYYYASYDEEPEDEQDEWMFWNIIMPLNGSRPKVGDKTLIFNRETGIAAFREIQPDETVKQWPYKTTDRILQAAIKSVFEV